MAVVCAALSDMPIGDIRTRHIRDFVRLANGRDHGTGTLRNAYGLLHTLFRDCPCIPRLRFCLSGGERTAAKTSSSATQNLTIV